MIDYSLPYYGLLMKKSDFSNTPSYKLPEGYFFCTYREGMKEDWVRIHTAAQMVETKKKASEAFDQKILPHDELLKEFCVFICDEDGQGVANASLLPGYHFGEMRWQVYWVAVMPEHNGLHLCHALIAYLVDLFCSKIGDEWMYLATQTWNYCAISVYKDLGFEPYLGPKPVNWVSDDFSRCNAEGWRIVDEQIKKYVIKQFREAYRRCLYHAERGEMCLPASLCELCYDQHGDAELIFMRKEKINFSEPSWDIKRLIVIGRNDSEVYVVDNEKRSILKTVKWINILSQKPVMRKISKQAFFVRMMSASGMLLRGCFPIMRHGFCYGQLPYGDTERLFNMRADLCRQMYDTLNPMEVTGFYDT